MKKNIQPILDSRHLKIINVKKDELKDSVVFVCLDEDKYGLYDVAQIRKLAEALERIEPDGCYFVGLKQFRVEIYDKATIKNRDIVITVAHQDDAGVAEEDVEQRFHLAFPEANSIGFVHHYAKSIDYKDQS